MKKQLMVNSTSGNIISQKMRDEIYMKHLRQVEKISNREAENLARDLHHYHSINDIRHKHRTYAFDWQQKQQDHSVFIRNQKIKNKIMAIRPYTRFRQPPSHPTDSNEHTRSHNPTAEPRGSTSPKPQERKNKHSLHYQYRKRRQEQIEMENERLQKCISSQRSTYLPKIKMRYPPQVLKRQEEGDEEALRG